MSPEEKRKIEDGFIEYVKERSPILRNVGDEALRHKFKMMSNFIDISEE
ncbi:hypothetical protein [Staphylococcus ursi]